MKNKLYILIAILFLILTSFIIIKNNYKKEYNKNLFYMDTYIDIKIYTNNKKEATKAFEGINNIYKKYHEITNIYDQNSEIFKVNNSNEEIIKISDELYDILKLALEYKELSKNKFNINLGNVTKLWKEYREKNIGVPSLEELKSAYIDAEIILLDNKSIKNNGLNLDLGGIAKGYATSMASKYLDKIGIENYIINAGGNVAVGRSYNKDKFSIGIEDPIKKNEVYKIIKGNNISVVTSGGYERFYVYEGVRYHHIIDPDTLYPAKNMLSVTVVAKDSAVADILSTTLFLLPLDEALELVNSLKDVEAIFYVDKDTIVKSEGLYKYE